MHLDVTQRRMRRRKETPSQRSRWKKSEISAMRKNQRPYTYAGFGGVENGHMVGVDWVWVLHTYYAQSSKIVNFYVSYGPSHGERLLV